MTAIVGSLLLLAQLAGSLHLALTAHHLCLEHGELVHDAEAAAPKVAGHGSALPADLQAGISACPDVAETASEQHDHCAVQLFRRSVLASPLQRLGAAPAVVALRPLRPLVRWVGVQAALFRLAPKHSPPA